MRGSNSNKSEALRDETAEAALGIDQQSRSPWPLALLAALFIIVPFMFWYGTWFGRPLSDEKTEQYLRDEKTPRHVQHALAQIAERIARGDQSVTRWYPQIVGLEKHPVADVRMTIAWVMGEDHNSEEFRVVLLSLLEDSEPMVRRNAALALVRYKDASGRPEICAMLKPYTIVAATEGTAQTVLTDGTPVKREAMLARIKSSEDRIEEIRSPLPGMVEKSLVREGDQIERGRVLFILAPDINSVWEGLRALYLIGETEDLADVEVYARGVERMPDRIKQQAALTIEAVKRRSSQKQISFSRR